MDAIKCPTCGAMVSTRFPMHHCSPKGQTLVEIFTRPPKRGDIVRRIDGKDYRVMRLTRTHVWVRWTAYGHDRRGLSRKLTWSEFQATLPHEASGP